MGFIFSLGIHRIELIDILLYSQMAVKSSFLVWLAQIFVFFKPTRTFIFFNSFEAEFSCSNLHLKVEKLQVLENRSHFFRPAPEPTAYYGMYITEYQLRSIAQLSECVLCGQHLFLTWF